MAENKNQHYLPQHYLRQFAVSGTNSKQIAVARLEPFLFIPRGVISGQCQEENFYNTDGDLDRLLTHFEDATAKVLSRVAREARFNAEDAELLRILSVVLHLRTKKSVERAKEFPRHVFFEVINAAIARGKLPPAPADWSMDTIDVGGAAGQLIQNTMIVCWLEMQTLDFKLLKAGPGTHFITSDHPVILLNQLMAHAEPHRSFVGFGRSGFQALMPISPSLCVFFYDPKVYKVGPRGAQLVPIGTGDVELINSLQVQSADRCVYCHDAGWEVGARDLVMRYGGLRDKHRNALRIVPGRTEKETLLHLTNATVELPRQWSFCRYRKNKTVGPDGRRHEAWSQMIQELAADMNSNPGGGDIFSRMETIIGIPFTGRGEVLGTPRTKSRCYH